MKTARDQVAALVGAAFPDEILFTSGGTESDNTAIRAGLAASPGRNEVVVSAVEHPAVLALIRQLETEGRIKAHVIPVLTCGCLDRERYRAALSSRTALVSIMWANNETGIVFPVEALAEEAKSVGAVFHTDAVQAAGREPIHLKRGAIDLLSLSSHKLHGPKGVGALYVRRGLKLEPLIYGGRQERARRGGTENVPGVVGFGKAAEIALRACAETRRECAHCATGWKAASSAVFPTRPFSGRAPNVCRIPRNRLRRRGGGGRRDDAGARRRRGLDRCRLLGGLERAVACAEGDEHSDGGGAGRGALFPVARDR